MASKFDFDSTPWPNGWTGGQYSVLRALLGACLFVHFVRLSVWFWGLSASGDVLSDAGQGSPMAFIANLLGIDDAWALVFAVTIGAAAASLFFAVGLAARWAAFGLCIALAGLYGLDPLLPSQGLTYLGWMLLAQVLMRNTPYGSVSVRGRPDPGGGWRMPGAVLLASWLLLGLSYLYSAHFLVFGPDSCWRRTAPKASLFRRYRAIISARRLRRKKGPAFRTALCSRATAACCLRAARRSGY